MSKILTLRIPDELYSRLQVLRGQVPLANFLKQIINNALAGPLGDAGKEMLAPADEASIQRIEDAISEIKAMQGVTIERLNGLGKITKNAELGVAEIWQAVVGKRNKYVFVRLITLFGNFFQGLRHRQ
jgi:hypothetical protein